MSCEEPIQKHDCNFALGQIEAYRRQKECDRQRKFEEQKQVSNFYYHKKKICKNSKLNCYI